MTSIASLVAFDNAYYDLLEVQVDASEGELSRQAYRRCLLVTNRVYAAADLKKAYKKQARYSIPFCLRQ